jgi:hypothetical protein
MQVLIGTEPYLSVVYKKDPSISDKMKTLYGLLSADKFFSHPHKVTDAVSPAYKIRDSINGMSFSSGDNVIPTVPVGPGGGSGSTIPGGSIAIGQPTNYAVPVAIGAGLLVAFILYRMNKNANK